jgi:hypothetical protein
MANKAEMQTRINAMVQQLHAIANRVNARTDSGGHAGLTPAEESEIFEIEQRIHALRKSL